MESIVDAHMVPQCVLYSVDYYNNGVELCKQIMSYC